MKILKYFYNVSSDKLKDRFQLNKDRTTYMTNDYIKMFKKELSSIELPGTTGVLYAAGASMHQGESRVYRGDYNNSLEILDDGPVIKTITAYMMHRYIGILHKKCNITYANINSNTCASSMYSIWEAEQLLNTGRVDNVIIITEEKTSFNTIRIFNEHNISVTPGEGFACIVLTKGEGDLQITNTKWGYKYNKNPFLVDSEGYYSVLSDYNYVKPHRTGTEQNDSAEDVVFGTENIISYKKGIGHTQGASGLIELCMILEEPVKGKILCVASGLGGFYGSCILNKKV